MERCPTCDGPIDETWPPGHHPLAHGPEYGVCGRCARSREDPVHEPQIRAAPTSGDLPSDDRLAEAIHAANRCSIGHEGDGFTGLEAVRDYHRPQARAILAELRHGSD